MWVQLALALMEKFSSLKYLMEQFVHEEVSLTEQLLTGLYSNIQPTVTFYSSCLC